MLGNIIHVHNEYLKALPIFTFLGFLSQFNRFWGFGDEWVGSGGGCTFMHSSHKQGATFYCYFS